MADHDHTPDTRRKLMRLGAAAEAAGVTANQLHYYLMVGVVEPTTVSDGGQRLFDAAAVNRIRLIRQLNNEGYNLREIREIFLNRK